MVGDHFTYPFGCEQCGSQVYSYAHICCQETCLYEHQEIAKFRIENPNLDWPRSPVIEKKDTNPKDAVGIRKWRQFTTVPLTVLWELGVAMLEGARKYGRHNYRVAGVRSSVYVDAAMGHLSCYWEGEDIDDLSGLHHVTKAIASLTVLRDAMIQEKYIDDRPPKTKNLEKVKADLQAVVDRMFEDHPEAKPAYLEGDQFTK
jgi:hypothetical protein